MKNNFIKALLDTPDEGEYSKVNIHFPIKGKVQKYCTDLNKNIQEITKSEIDFSPSSYQIPHLTLYMGFVKSDSEFKNVMDIVADYAQTMKPLTIDLTKPYLKAPKYNWAFIDTQQAEDLKQIKRDIKQLVGKHMVSLNWDVVEEDPHITVGYIKENADNIIQLFHSFNLPPILKIDSIEVSYSGARGSCVGTIKSFDF